MSRSYATNYDQIAGTYHQRYENGKLDGIAAALKDLVYQARPEHVLEVGCGTGRWLSELQEIVKYVYGIDPFTAMLHEARRQGSQCALVSGDAIDLPFSTSTFDLIFCVNAIHHFGKPHVFITEARRLLKANGILAVIGMDPRACRESWYVYHYFEGVYKNDVRRFPSWEAIEAWMLAEGFINLSNHVVERTERNRSGRAVLADPFLQKNASSQLATLSDEEYAVGVQRIKDALTEAETLGKDLDFPMTIRFSLQMGQVCPDQSLPTTVRSGMV
jgi:ubiquinone/menaquinone biosynthesis C-methylase UbiE